MLQQPCKVESFENFEFSTNTSFLLSLIRIKLANILAYIYLDTYSSLMNTQAC